MANKHFSKIGTKRRPILNDFQLEKAIDKLLKNTKNHPNRYFEKSNNKKGMYGQPGKDDIGALIR